MHHINTSQLTEKQLREEIKTLELHFSVGNATSAQANRLRELRAALENIVSVKKGATIGTLEWEQEHYRNHGPDKINGG